MAVTSGFRPVGSVYLRVLFQYLRYTAPSAAGNAGEKYKLWKIQSRHSKYSEIFGLVYSGLSESYFGSSDIPNMTQDQINQYFAKTWLKRDRTIDKYKYSGWALLEKIVSSEWVLDVGCGNNYFKPYLNVVGIDPANDRADLKQSLEAFQSDKCFDVAFCLGSINFGATDNIREQIAKLVTHLKPSSRIYWRCNPGLHDHGNEDFQSITVYPWSFEVHQNFSKEFGFTVNDLRWDTDNRIYAEWVRR